MKVFIMLMALVMATSVRAEFGDGKRATSAAERKEDRIERREDFKLKLAKIKDQKKKAIVEKLDARFNEVNVKRTTQMTKHLDKMAEILTKVDGDTASASSAIQAARDAVTVQAAKTYVITISSEANLKTDVGKVRSQLEADLRAVNELVIVARKAVQSLIK